MARDGWWPGALLPRLTVAIAVAGLSAPGPLPAVQAVAFGLVLPGAVSGAILARAAERIALWQVAFGSLAASVALAPPGSVSSRAVTRPPRVATLAVPLVIAISAHMLLALPDGRLASRGSAWRGADLCRGPVAGIAWRSPRARSRPGGSRSPGRW